MIIFEQTQSGGIVSGSASALSDAILTGDDIRLSLDAVDSYFEVLALPTCFVQHDANLCGGMAWLAQTAYGDKFGGVQDYYLHAVFLSDRRSLLAREPNAWSNYTGNLGGVSTAGRYGYYRWIAAGRPMTVIASSDDLNSMEDFRVRYKAGEIADFKVRFLLAHPTTGATRLTYVVPANSIFYDPKDSGEPGVDTWLMSWHLPNPDWTIKTARVPIPSYGDPRLASFVAPAYMIIANAILHCRGYAAFHGRPISLCSEADYSYPVAHDWVGGGTKVEILARE